jgi:hypothetical protein
VILGFHVFVKPDDIGVMQFVKDASLIQDLLFSRLVHTLDGHELESAFSSGLENDRVLAACLLLVDVVLVHLNLIIGRRESKIAEGNIDYVQMAQTDSIMGRSIEFVVFLGSQLHPDSFSCIGMMKTPLATSKNERAVSA